MKTAAIGGLIIVGALAFALAYFLIVGWIAYTVYGAVAPEDWPTIGYWPSVGIVFLATLVFGGSARAANN